MVIAALITCSVMSSGFLFEGKSGATLFESIRLLLTGAILLFMLKNATAFTTIAVLIAVIVLLSVYWIQKFYQAPLSKISA